MDLASIKDEVARRYGYGNWEQFDDLLTFGRQCDVENVVKMIDKIAIACQEQLRRDCAELCKLPSDKQAILKTPLIK